MQVRRIAVNSSTFKKKAYGGAEREDPKKEASTHETRFRATEKEEVIS